VPYRKQRHFGAREETVDRDQQNYQQYAKWGVGHVIPDNSIEIS
jgi:hypothetical protein